MDQLYEVQANPAYVNYADGMNMYHAERGPQIKLRNWESPSDCNAVMCTPKEDFPNPLSDAEFTEVLKQQRKRIYYVECILHHGAPLGGYLTMIGGHNLNMINSILNFYRMFGNPYNQSLNIKFHVDNLDYVLIEEMFPYSEAGGQGVSPKGKEEMDAVEDTGSTTRIDIEEIHKKNLYGFYKMSEFRNERY